MNDTLKVAGRIGAELGAVKAENEKLRGLLRTAWRLRPDHDYHDEHMQAEQKAWEVEAAEVLNAADALSQQAEPTDTYTAVDMATAAAQDEQEVAAVIGFYEGEREPRLLSWNVLPNGEHRLYTRPAQTEQQPAECTNEDSWNCKYCRKTETCEAIKDPRNFGARIAQTAPQGKFSMGDLVKKSTGSEWQGRICGTYSTALTPEGYAVESEAHAGSVQIYPAKALEAVE